MNTHPLVTIVIPVYNGANYLREAIQSALNQSYRNLEIIVVNDGSNDNGKTEKIATSFGSSIRYFYKENGGAASALNLGLQQMRGEYFNWLSHDDYYLPAKIETFVDHLRSMGPQSGKVLFCDYQIIDQDGVHVKEVRFRKGMQKNMIFEMLVDTSMNFCTLMVPATNFKKAGPFRLDLPEVQDYEMLLRLAENFEFEHVPKTLFVSRIHSEQGQVVRLNKYSLEKRRFISDFLKNVDADELHKNPNLRMPWGFLKLFVYLNARAMPAQGKDALQRFFSLYGSEWDPDVIMDEIRKTAAELPTMSQSVPKLLFALSEFLELKSIDNGPLFYSKVIELLHEKNDLKCEETYLLASSYKKLGNHDASVEKFVEIISKCNNPGLLGGAYFHIGECRYNAAQYQEAGNMFQKCLEFIPNHLKAREYLSLNIIPG